MDFLDPRKKRARSVRLMIGNSLIAIAIAMATLILVYMAYGYNFDRKSGQIVQTGLVFISTQPVDAKIYLNGADKGNTSARFVLDAGNYQIKLQRSGYRTWQRNLVLEGNSIERFIYPLMIPNTLTPQTLDTYTNAPVLLTESPDRHWVVLAEQPSNNKFSFSIYDTTKLETGKIKIDLPADLFSSSLNSAGSLKLVEWSSDNKNVLLEHTFNATTEYIVVNRDAPAKSFNVNKLFGVVPQKVSLYDKKADQLYLLVPAKNQLELGNVKDHSVSTVLPNVLDFKAYGNNLLSYAAPSKTTADSVAINIWDDGKIYNLSNISAGTKYLLDIAQFQGDWFYVVGSDKQPRVEVYKNPLDSLKNEVKASKFFLLHTDAAQKVEFSTNARFVMSESGQNVAIYDFETQRSYLYTVTQPLTGNLHWMDGHRLIGVSDGKTIVFDYDYNNLQTLTTTSYEQAALFDRDYLRMFVLAPNSAQKQMLESIEMRTPADIPNGDKLKLNQ